MESITKKQILESIGKVYEQSKKCKLNNSFFESINTELRILSEYFKTSPQQTFFIAVVFALNYKGMTVNFSDMIEYFDCNPMKLLEYNDDLEHLQEIGIFNISQTYRRRRIAGTNDNFVIPGKITEAILQDKPLPKISKKEKKEDVIDFLDQLYKLGEDRESGLISSTNLFLEVEEMIHGRTHFPLIKKVSQFNFHTEDTYLYLFLIWKTILGNESLYIESTLDLIYDNPSDRISETQKLLKGSHILIKNNLVEIIEAQFFNDTEMKLTDASFQLLKDCGIQLFLNKVKKDNVISPSEIVYRELIFDSQEMSQLETLKSLLQEDKFTETQTRLLNKGLPKGIAVLLHGLPGTGKTEIVKQMAKATDREIVKVEISQLKSMWFGESEKIIKRVFTDYKAYAKECPRTPILFFNEADAVISKRKDGSSSLLDQTENAIQNIILEELENFEGILMATTNLVRNLDTAFERRFLFKVQFHKPSIKTRAQIWLSKLPELGNERSWKLAEKFDFSGGQIDNIIRKSEIQQIVYGQAATFELIESFCSEEFVTKEATTKIGF